MQLTEQQKEALEQVALNGARAVFTPGSQDVDFICTSELEAYKLAYELNFYCRFHYLRNSVTPLRGGSWRVSIGEFLEPGQVKDIEG